MPPRELAGPAGRLEALLELPVPPGTVGHDGHVTAHDHARIEERRVAAERMPAISRARAFW